MRILLFCNDHYHPGEVPINGMAPLKGKGFAIDVVTDATGFDLQNIFGYNVLIMSKCDNISAIDTASWKSEALQDAIIDFVENGGGLLVTHNGTVCGPNTQKLDNLIGCRFISHPDACLVTVGPVKPHPITSDVGIFCETDEQYRLEILTNDIDILAASYSDEYISPCAYVRTQGKGRVCVLTPGHELAVWLNSEFQKLLENALNWCAGFDT